MVTLRIDQAALGRPLDHVVSVHREALLLASDDWRRCPPDAVDVIRGVLMAVEWLGGTADVSFDPSIPCPPHTPADLDQQCNAAWRVLRFIGRGDKSANDTVFAMWDMLAFALGRSDQSPVEKVLRRRQAA